MALSFLDTESSKSVVSEFLMHCVSYQDIKYLSELKCALLTLDISSKVLEIFSYLYHKTQTISQTIFNYLSFCSSRELGSANTLIGTLKPTG